MSGHSKWATTKHKKAVVDAKRGKLFAKLIKNIEVAARTGGGDMDGNPTLYDAVQKARKNSVPLDNIERAVKRGSGAEAGGADWQTIMYEGYAPGGVALLVERAKAHGGAVSYKANPDGTQSPYELNINYFDALSDPAAGEPLDVQASRFLVSQAIARAFMGMPGIYIHSLLGSRNWNDGVRQTGHLRSINREKLDLGACLVQLYTGMIYEGPGLVRRLLNEGWKP